MSQELLIRNSEISTYKECRLKWWWSYVKQRESIEERGPLALGSLVHAALERWYVVGKKRAGKHLHDHVAAAYAELFDGSDTIYHNPVPGSNGDPIAIDELAVEMLKNYQDEWGKDDHIEVIAPEMTFAVTVLDAKNRDCGTAVGTIDLTVFDHNIKRFGFMEHKTGATLQPFGAPEHMDEQNGMYWTYGPIYLEHLGIVNDQSQITFLQYNRMAKNISTDDRPVNEDGLSLNRDGSISKQQPQQKFLRSNVYRTVDQRRALDKRFAQVAKEMQLARERKLPIYKSPGRQCSYCQFRDACEVHEAAEDYQSVLQSTTRKWDPYVDHRDTEVQERG